MPVCPVHLTSAAVSCMRVAGWGLVAVDLSVLQWYQKQAGLVGVFPFQGAGTTFSREGLSLEDEP